MTADDDRKRRLDKTVTDLQGRFGLRAIGRRATAAAPRAISTGFATLDEALGIGGLPLGRPSEIVGAPTSGMATLALKTIAAAQAGTATTGPLAAYLDLEKTFDPDYAARCGVDLRRLLVIRPYTARQGVAMLPDLVLNGGFGVLVVDAPLPRLAAPEAAEALAATLARLIAPLDRAGCALLFLSALPPRTDAREAQPDEATTGLPHYAAVRLLIQRERWLYRRGDVSGYEAQVLVLKNRLAAEGQTATIAITFNGVVRGEAS